MIVLVCGSRYWTDAGLIRNKLVDLYDEVTQTDTLTVIEGGAKGADRIAGAWAANARTEQVGWVRFNADWSKHGKAAGPLRNQEMLRWLLDAEEETLVYAFKDEFDYSSSGGSGRGTEHMVHIARVAGIPVRVFSHD